MTKYRHDTKPITPEPRVDLVLIILVVAFLVGLIWIWL
jgi:hypothetical protein